MSRLRRREEAVDVPSWPLELTSTEASGPAIDVPETPARNVRFCRPGLVPWVPIRIVLASVAGATCAVALAGADEMAKARECRALLRWS
jgi:hypothetical protein